MTGSPSIAESTQPRIPGAIHRRRADGIERLAPQDRISLWPDQAGWPQDIGLVARLEGGALLDRPGGIQLDVARDWIAARTARVPRMSQIVCTPPFWCGGPLWQPVDALDLHYHVQITEPLPHGDEDLLWAQVQQIRRRKLDQDRPLWQVWFISAPAQRIVWMYVRAHHAIADGVAGVAMLEALLSPAATTLPRTDRSTPLPSNRDLFIDNIIRQCCALRRAVATAKHPTRIRHAAAVRWSAVYDLLTEQRAPLTSLNKPVGSRQRMVVTRCALGVMRSIAHRHQATVNDVLLTAVAGGLRELLIRRGENVDDLTLRTVVPVSLHQASEDPHYGNRLGQLIVPLPLGLADPVVRLEVIATATTQAKSAVQPRLVPATNGTVTRRAAMWILTRQRMANVSVTDVAGPPETVSFAGTAILEIVPVIALMGNVAVGVAGFSYRGQFAITIATDEAVCPEPGVIRIGVEDTIHALQTHLAGGGLHVGSRPADRTDPPSHV